MRSCHPDVLEPIRRLVDGLAGLLSAHMTVPEHTVRHSWAAGDLAIWDNRTTMHDAAVDDGDAPRSCNA